MNIGKRSLGADPDDECFEMDPAGIIASESGQSSLLFCFFDLLGLLGGLAAFTFTLAALVLDVLIIDIKGLINLGTQSSIVLNAKKKISVKLVILENMYLQVNELGVIHLQKHASDFACQVCLHDLDLGEQSLSKKLFLLVRRDASKLSL